MGSDSIDWPHHPYTHPLDLLKVEWRAYDTPWQQKYAEYTYANKLVTRVTDANGNQTEMRYDDHGRLSRRVYPSKTGGQVNEDDYQEYRYDVNSNLRWERKRNEKEFTYEYDNLNRMTKKDVPDTSSLDVHYGYELSGAQTFARFCAPNGQGITLNYTGFGEPETETINLGGVSRTLNRQFDQNGNRTRIEHPDGEFFVYTYDGLDRLQSIQENGATTLIIDTYDQYARPESRSTTGNAVTTLSYDDASRLAAIDYQFTDTNDLTLGFEYNPADQITRLSHSTDLYRYFGNDNQTGTYVVNALNQYDSVNGTVFSYDDNGNLTDDGPNSYTYDAENRLIGVSGSVNAMLAYDTMGRLYRYTVNGQTTEFLYDGDSLIAEYQGGAVTKRYVHSTSVDTPLVQYTGSSVGASNRQFLHKNQQGSVIAISNNSGNVIEINNYDAYGLPESSNEGRFGYTGQLWLKEIGLYYYKTRMYSPALGRFLQTDLVSYEDQMNLYAYVGNDPLNNTDPTGMFGVAGFLIGAGIEIVAQLATQGTVTDWKSVGIAGAVGIVTGGIGGRLAVSAAKGVITTSQAIRGTAAVAGVTSGVGSAAGDIVNGKEVDVTKAAISTVTGAVGGAVGAKVANAGTAALEKMAAKGGIAANVAATTRSAQLAPRAEATTSGVQKAATTASDAAIAVSQKELEKRFDQ